jgi:GNAT superfamily N-acetyltransferase
VSSLQPNSLPDGYSLRLATKKDLFKLFYFEYFSHESSAKNRTIGWLLLFLLILYSVWKINIPIYLMTIIFIVPIGWSILFYFSNCIDHVAKRSLSVVLIVEYKREIFGFLSCAQRGNFRMIVRLLVASSHQNIGIGSALIHHCINRSEIPIYLECQPILKNYYHKFGFVSADLSNIPAELLPRKAYYTSPHATLMVLDS